MKLSEFRYTLPAGLIAQQPLPERDGARLMVLDRRTGGGEDRVFRDLPGLLAPGDLVVLNDTRVLPARLSARKESGVRVEVLLLEKEGPGPGAAAPGGFCESWRALVRGFGRRRPGARFEFEGALGVELIGEDSDPGGGGEVVRVLLRSPRPIEESLRRAGSPPTPPYIRREPGDPRLLDDRERYQTVFAEAPGAIAAPTAGLHFTHETLAEIRDRGAEIQTLTLHVGWGTFQPVRVEEIEDHIVAPERCLIGAPLARAYERAKSEGRRVVAVGTTVVRALEDALDSRGRLRVGESRCGLVILPGHRFRAVDALVTNFHLPESSLLLLVAAFAGKESILSAYREGVRKQYRFYSYGDAMFIR